MTKYWPHSEPATVEQIARDAADEAARLEAEKAAKVAAQLAERATDARKRIIGDVGLLLDKVETHVLVDRSPRPFIDRPSEWRDPEKDHEPALPPTVPFVDAVDIKSGRKLMKPLGGSYVNPSAGHWPSISRHETTAPGLLEQLHDQEEATLRAGSSNESGGKKPAPDSRPPDGVWDFLAITTEIEAGAVDLWVKARKHLGWRTSLMAFDENRGQYTYDPTTEKAMRDLIKLVDLVPDQLAVDICRTVHKWVSVAQVTLSYIAPVVALKDPCWYCGGVETLKVRSDASSDLWCSNHEWHDEHDDVPRRWPRGMWLMMLAEGAS